MSGPCCVLKPRDVYYKMSGVLSLLTVPVLCTGNSNSYYNGKTWNENVRHIVEHNRAAINLTNTDDV